MPDYAAQLNQARARAREKSKVLIEKTERNKKTRDRSLIQPAYISLIEFLVIFCIGLLDDVLDYFGADLVSFRAIDLTCAAILGFWCVFRLKKFPSERFIVTFFIELIPFLGDFSPTWAIFIIWTYLDQRDWLPETLKKLGETKSIKPK